MDIAEGIGELGKGPQVDTCLRLVEDHQRGLTGQNGGDLNALDLAAGETDVYLPLQIIVGTQAHFSQILAAAVLAQLFLTRRQQQKVVDGDALEAGGAAGSRS